MSITRTAQEADEIRTRFGHLINSDPIDGMSEIGRNIFKYLDIATAIAFSQVSKGLNERSKNRWFVNDVRHIVIKYIHHKATYKDYLASGGWSDYIALGLKVGGVAFTLASSVEAGIHANLVPDDAPVIKYKDASGHACETTEHPEARKAESWVYSAVAGGGITIFGIAAHSIYNSSSNLDMVLSTTEKELFGSTPEALKIISPRFHNWKMQKIKENYTAQPVYWRTHPDLMSMICPLSEDFMLFPVKDACGHHYDYRSLRTHQLKSTTINPYQCPLSTTQPNTGLARIRFDKAKFDLIQRTIKDNQTNNLR